MLTFRTARLIFAVLLAAIIVYDFSQKVPWWVYAALLIAYLIVIFRGSYFIQSGFFLKALCSGDKNSGSVAITFDDGPHENTATILNVLKEYGAPATFFCIGRNIPGKEDVIRMIHEAGHQVGNHSFSHSNFYDFYSVGKLIEDVSKTDELILKLTGKANWIFRPPFGVTTPNIARMAIRKKYHVIGWSIRSYDTVTKDQERLTARVLNKMAGGSVILLHDSTPGIEIVLRNILDHARQKKFKIVSLSELFNIRLDEPAT